MRIFGGKLKGRKISAGKFLSDKNDSNELRPTSAKVRESIFNILQKEINGADFLDLYAGTGAVGLEAISRGAGKVWFVENSKLRSKQIIDYLRKFGFTGMADVFHDSSVDFIKRTSASGQNFDIIFADPPYASDEIMKIIQNIGASGVLRSGGCFLVEHSSKVALPEEAGDLSRFKNYKYGDTMLTLYRRDK